MRQRGCPGGPLSSHAGATEMIVMPPEPAPPQTSVSSRDCPVCGQPVHWSRYWLRTRPSAKWPCGRCGSLLGFDGRCRVVIALLITAVLGAFAIILPPIRFWIAFPLLLVASSAVALIDRVTVVGNRNDRFCPGCSYDLTGTLAAGITRCPECGYELPQKARSTSVHN
jgi:hypothetical protein